MVCLVPEMFKVMIDGMTSEDRTKMVEELIPKLFPCCRPPGTHRYLRDDAAAK
jgi:hypothetical protein